MEKYKFDDAVAETLLIPLYMRAKESRRGDKAILRDPIAQKLVDSIAYDYSKFDGARLSETGCNVRCWYLDNVAVNFIDSHESPVIVNAGCGLDARCQRIAAPGVPFYSLDLPEVIDIREKLMPPAPDETYLSCSLFDTSWMHELAERHTGCRFLIIFEGVLMYFDEKRVKELFANLCRYFPGAELWFDTCGSLAVKNQDKHDTVKNVSARFLWALDNGRIPEAWSPSICLIKQTSQGLFFRRRYPLFMNLLSRFPRLLFRFCSIVGYRIG